MDQSVPSLLSIEISAVDATPEELDFQTRQLLSELVTLDLESASLAQGAPAPAGAKGDPVTIGSIAVQLLPTLLPGVISMVQAWASRAPGRTVKFKGQGIEFEGSADDLEKLLAGMSSKPKRKQ